MLYLGIDQHARRLTIALRGEGGHRVNAPSILFAA